MTPIEQACAQLLDRQAKRNTLHLRFGSAMKSPQSPRGARAAEKAAGDDQ
jgi:hypothetical protein